MTETDDLFTTAIDFLKGYFQQQLFEEWKSAGLDPNLQPDTFSPFGFHIVGFSPDAKGSLTPKTALVSIGKTPVVKIFESIGCAWSGDGRVVGLLWGNTGTPFANANFEVFSLQDAIDYAKFLIRTTADYQRFSGRLPTVGGDIDIALVTNHRGFQWIAQKELYRILDKEETNQ
jgi:hypothetical protein